MRTQPRAIRHLQLPWRRRLRSMQAAAYIDVGLAVGLRARRLGDAQAEWLQDLVHGHLVKGAVPAVSVADDDDAIACNATKQQCK